MSRELLEALLRGDDLSVRDVDRLVGALVDPASSDSTRAALLVALRAKGETIGELGAFARALRARATVFPGPRAAGAIDLCGSGGASRPSFNFGTVSAFVVRAAGVPVAKHGNRSARGAERGWAGSSDLLEALGLPFVTSREYALACFRQERITFLHAPLYHVATRAVADVRRSLGVPTVFNWIGPLTNPAAVRYQLVGCPTPARASEVARVLPLLGVVRGGTVSGSDGVDEFSPSHRSVWITFGRGRRSMRHVDPRGLLEREDRRGPWGPLPAREAAQEAERLLAGGGGARRGGVLLTSGAALFVRGVADSLADGVARAAEALDSGEAEAILERLRGIARGRSWGSAP